MKKYRNFEKLCWTVPEVILAGLGAISILYGVVTVLDEIKPLSFFMISGCLIVFIMSLFAFTERLQSSRTCDSKTPLNLLKTYTVKDLKKICLTSKEPGRTEAEKGTTQYVLKSMIKGLSRKPVYIQHISSVIFVQAFQCLCVLFFYSLAYMSGCAGLTDFTTSFVGNFFGWLLVLYIFGTWLLTFFDIRQIIKFGKAASSERIYMIAVRTFFETILLPLLVLRFYTLLPLYGSSFSSLPWLTVEGIITTVMCAGFFTFIISRKEEKKIKHHVSKETHKCKINLHPMTLFHILEKILTKNGGHKYLDKSPVLKNKNNDNNMNFTGCMIYETQETLLDNEKSINSNISLMTSVVLSYCLLFLGVFCLFYFISIKEFSTAIFSFLILSGNLFPFIYIITSLIWKEDFYTSHLVCFSTKGTYKNSKSNNRIANYESFKDLIESHYYNFSLSLYVTKITSRTFTLKGRRYIESVEEDYEKLKELKQSIEQYIFENNLTEKYAYNDTESKPIIIDEMRNFIKAAHNNDDFPSNNEKHITIL